MRFESKTVLVTGAGHGIGAASARRFATEGAHVHVADIDADSADEVAVEITNAGGSAQAWHLDVGSSASWEALRERMASRQLDVVVNNAFTVVLAAAHELAPADWERQIAVDLSAVYHSVRMFMPDLRARRGCLVNVASVHALVGFRARPAYAAAKGGVVALTRQLAVEYAPEVRANCVVPGPILTAAWDVIDASGRERAGRSILAGRLGDPAEVANCIAFLASDEASFVTGASLVVDGGQTAAIDSD